MSQAISIPILMNILSIATHHSHTSTFPPSLPFQNRYISHKLTSPCNIAMSHLADSQPQPTGDEFDIIFGPGSSLRDSETDAGKAQKPRMDSKVSQTSGGLGAAQRPSVPAVDEDEITPAIPQMHQPQIQQHEFQQPQWSQLPQEPQHLQALQESQQVPSRQQNDSPGSLAATTQPISHTGLIQASQAQSSLQSSPQNIEPNSGLLIDVTGDVPPNATGVNDAVAYSGVHTKSSSSSASQVTQDNGQLENRALLHDQRTAPAVQSTQLSPAPANTQAGDLSPAYEALSSRRPPKSLKDQMRGCFDRSGPYAIPTLLSRRRSE